MHKLITLLTLTTLLGACASSDYRYGTGEYGQHPGSVKPKEQVIVGRPHAVLDAADWIWPGSWLAKLLLWDKNVDSHQIADETVEKLLEYTEKNALGDVQILVNAYRPGVQWNRLFRNRQVGAGWRYTLGIISASVYTILPGRFFGGDHYNPYTNTLSIYSDNPAIALHEGGHAKDTAKRQYKGLNAAIYALPGAALYYEAVATHDALSYLEHECRFHEESDAYKILHPAYGTYVGGLFLQQSGFGFLGVIPGHISGRINAALVDDNPEHHTPPCPNQATPPHE